MKLFKYYKKEDFGVEHSFIFLSFGNYRLLQLFLNWDDYPSWPYLQVSFGHGRLLDFLFFGYKFSINLVLLNRIITLNDEE